MTFDGVTDAQDRGALIACLKVKAVNGGAPCRREGLMVPARRITPSRLWRKEQSRLGDTGHAVTWVTTSL